MIESINLHPDIPQLDARNVDQLFAMFLSSLASRSPITVRNLRTKVKYFLNFWAEHKANYKSILTPSVLNDFVVWLDNYQTSKGDKLKHNTKADCIKRTRQALRWAFRNGYLSSDWSKHVPAANGRPIQHDALELADVRKLFDQCLLSRDHLRDCALLAVLAGTGVRRNECSFIRAADVHFTNGQSGYIDIAEGKGGTRRKVAFDSNAGRFIKLHLDRNCTDKTDKIWFFEGRIDGSRLAAKSIGILFNRFAESAGVAGWDGCHQFRRSFATHWVKVMPGEGHAVLLAKEMGHSVPNLTLGVYTKLSIEDVRKLMERTKVSLFAQMMRNV